MNTTTHQRDDLSTLSGRGTLYGLPLPLNDEDGGGDCHPTDENEIGP